MILFALSLFFLAIALFFQIRFQGRVLLFQYLFFASLGAIILFYLVLVYFQYNIWKEAGPPSSYLVPPYQSITYVFSYHFIRFGLSYLISFGVAFFAFFLMRILNAKFKKRFFEREEPYLAALSVFLLGNPSWNYAWIYYVLALGCISVFGSFLFRYALRRPRLSFYWLWIPTAVGVIIIMNFYNSWFLYLPIK